MLVVVTIIITVSFVCFRHLHCATVVLHSSWSTSHLRQPSSLRAVVERVSGRAAAGIAKAGNATVFAWKEWTLAESWRCT